MLRPGNKKEFKVSFSPDEARVVVSTAIVTIKEEEKSHARIVKMSGIGKFPFVHASDEKVNFEPMTVGTSESKRITLRNHSQVLALYSIKKINDDEKDTSFALSSRSGEIVPGGSETITVTYTPTLPGTITCTQYSINIHGGNELRFSAMGQSLGNNVYLSNTSIHFGEVQLESTTNRLLNVCNDSD
jgi:hypothetical protein